MKVYFFSCVVFGEGTDVVAKSCGLTVGAYAAEAMRKIQLELAEANGVQPGKVHFEQFSYVEEE